MSLIQINSIEIYYEFHKVKNADRTVALLNGVMASTSSWDIYLDHFKGLGCNVLLHDFRGQLKSQKPGTKITFEDHIQDLKMLMEELNIEKADLVGTSYGGEVAMFFASRLPSMTSTLTIIDSVSQLSPLLKTAINSWIKAAETGDGPTFFRILLPWLYSSSFIKKNENMLKERMQAMAKLSEEYFRGQISLYKSFLSINITAELSKITCPALIICGEEDLLKPPPFSKIIADNIKASEYYILPECGHVAVFEKPEELISLISGFFMKYQA